MRSSFDGVDVQVHSQVDANGKVICDTGARVRLGEHTLSLSLLLHEDALAPLFSGTAWAGTVIWDAALLMCEHVLHAPPEALQSRRVLELGAGIGVPSMAAALKGAVVCTTEHGDLVPLLRHNVAINSMNDVVDVRTLDWESDEDCEAMAQSGTWDVIIVCDCVYEPLYGQSWRRLALVLKLLAQARTTEVWISLERRTGDGIDNFLQHLELSFHANVVEERGSLLLIKAVPHEKNDGGLSD